MIALFLAWFSALILCASCGLVFGGMYNALRLDFDLDLDLRLLFLLRARFFNAIFILSVVFFIILSSFTYVVYLVLRFAFLIELSPTMTFA